MPEREERGDWTPARWLRILLPAAVIIVWLVAAGAGGPTFGKLSSVSTNDQSSFLPASADSTKVSDLQRKFSDSDSIPAVVVLASHDVIPKRDLPRFAALGKTLATVDGVQAAGKDDSSAVAGPIPSADGKAVEFIVPITDTGNVSDIVSGLRAAVDRHLPKSVRGYVTGPAGLTADLTNAFGGIDGILLLVAGGAVFVILLLVYRSIVLPILVLLTAVFALTGAILLVYEGAKLGWITLNGQSQGILSILVIGAATDYALLLVARQREALQQVKSRWSAIGRAWRAALPPIAASGATVILALLCLLFSDLNSNKSLGPIAAIGIAFALLAALSLLPMLLAVFGRAAFWPFRPKYAPDGVRGHKHEAIEDVPGLEGVRGLWRRVATVVSHRPRVTWIASLLLLGICTVGIFQLKATGVPQSDLVLTQSEAADGQKVAARHFPSGNGSPVVIAVNRSRAQQTLKEVKSAPGISSASVYSADRSGPGKPGLADPIVKDGKVLINAVLTAEPDSSAAEKVVKNLRVDLPRIDPDVLVGGVTATDVDTTTTAEHDLVTIIPIVLVVILLILMLLLRAVIAPIVLIATVVVSYIAALGVAALVFNHIFDFPGADASVPLFGFVFLVALGVDYNIFLMTRVREEAVRLGTRPGIVRGLSKTGSVITSAGVVLAATFAALAVIPILFLAQIAFIVAFGVLLDTMIVRSLLVPALSYDIGAAIWWPSKLRKAERTEIRARV